MTQSKAGNGDGIVDHEEVYNEVLAVEMKVFLPL